MRVVAFFVLVLFAILGLLATMAGTSRAQTSEKVIEISAKRFGFTPDHITLKKGEPVKLRFASQDVAHGFFIRELKVDEVLEPGKTVEVEVNPARTGEFTAICHHFCGAGHGNMKMAITVEE